MSRANLVKTCVCVAAVAWAAGPRPGSAQGQPGDPIVPPPVKPDPPPPPPPPAPDPVVGGRFSPEVIWPISATHLVLLPTGKVLAVGEFEEGDLEPRLWDPATEQLSTIARPGFNVFCAGHSALADGRILFAGGHRGESHFGLEWATLFDPFTSTWPTKTGAALPPTTLPAMNNPRWYPTNTTLPNGEVLVMSGEMSGAGQLSITPQVFDPVQAAWRTLTGAVRRIPYYPRNFVAPDGKVFVTSNEAPATLYVDTTGLGSIQFVANRQFTLNRTEYFAAAMYAPGKVLVAGGGGGFETGDVAPGSSPPTSIAEVIDLNAPTPRWRLTKPMNVARRQATATLLPDGKVLVLGGSTGGRFDDYRFPAYEGEIWDPTTEKWTRAAPTADYHGYHSASLLLPDGRVLFGGGTRIYPGQPGMDRKVRSVQVYSPPYLFKGPRPQLGRVPRFIEPGTTFSVETPDPGAVARVALLRLGAVTHAFDQDQRLVPVEFTRGDGSLEVKAPGTNAIAPPGHYMLFLLGPDGVPSVAKIVKVNLATPGGSSDPLEPERPPPVEPPPPDPVFPVDPEPVDGAGGGGDAGGGSRGGGGCSTAGGVVGLLALAAPLGWSRARRRRRAPGRQSP